MNYPNFAPISLHDMKLQKSPFEMIKSGEKTVEIRLYDEKRQLLKIGDVIRFSLIEDPDSQISCKILALHKFDSFHSLFKSELFKKCGCGNLSVEQSVAAMYKYYTKENERRFGVLGIEITPINI